MHAVVDDADAEEQRARDDAVRDHLEHAAGHALRGGGEDAHGDEAHMRHRRIGDQLLDVFLHQGHQRGVDDRDHRQRENQPREIMRRQREHRQREAQEAVAAHLQQDRRQDHRARGRRLDMGVRQPGMNRPHRHLHGERRKECKPRPHLQRPRHGRVHQGRDIGGAGVPVQRHDRKQHQDRTEQRVQEELEGGVDPARAAPYADDQEHRDQATLEEQIEQHEVERAESADHQRFQKQERHHVFAHAYRDRFPARDDAERHQGGGEDHERQRNAIDAHVIGDPGRKPRCLLDELEIRVRRIEAPDQDQRYREGDQCSPQRNPARISPCRFILAPADIDDQRADDRQECNDEENGPGCHHWPPKPNMNQVINPATPINIAKA